LKKQKKYEEFGLWGRSMGAVTALLYSQKDTSISVLALDSPFKNMNKLANEIAKQKTNMPSLILKGAIALIKSTIQKKVKFSLDDIDVMPKIEKSVMPALFITSKEDTLISPNHSEKIFEKYRGIK
jgi:hypothetical protein